MRKNQRLFTIAFFVMAFRAFASTIDYSTAVSFSTGISPRGIAVGRIVNENSQNLIVANFGSPTFIGQSTSVSILDPRNSFIQIFAPGTNGLNPIGKIQTASSPRGVFAFDSSGRGVQDILVTCYDANLLQVFRWANGQFVKMDEQETMKMPVGVTASWTRPGGLSFVAVANFGSNTISLFPIKDGKLGKRVDVTVSNGPTQIGIGDLDGSGDNQIIVACLSSNKLDVIAKSVSADKTDLDSFAVVKTIPLPEGSAPSDIKVVDLNGDGRADIAVAGYSKNTLMIYYQQKDGTLLAAPVLSTSGEHPNGLAVADIKRDGTKEVIVANRDSDTLDIFDPVNGQFQLNRTLKVTEEDGSSYGPVEVGVMDTRGNGKQDIIATHMRSNSIRVLNSQADPMPTPTPEFTNGNSQLTPFSDKSTFSYPNPSYEGKVKIVFNLEIPTSVKLRIYDVVGNLIWNEDISASKTQSGVNTITWMGANQQGEKVASGLYLYNITVGGLTVTKKTVLIH